MQKETQIVARIKALRKVQPSAIGNSIFMLLVRWTSLFGFVVLTVTSIFLYSTDGTTPKHDRFGVGILANKMIEMAHIRAENAVNQAYLLMVIALMLLAIWRLTTMILIRNNYIYTLNEVMDETITTNE